ncbi:MAG TPA: acyl-CoA dehydrogenase family protein, partial [Burkholderiales bacterium]|nr:acyl-CoA dehydrogenase family protein [Burkholderiales bacterium]
MSDPRYAVAGSGTSLDVKQKELIALAESLGPAFAARAEKYDREASFPFENYADLKQAGLLGLCVPEKFGGMGADLRTYALVSATLGKYCGATALTFNMHACSTLWPGLLADDLDMTAEQKAEHERYRAVHFSRVVKEGAIYAQPFSEGSAAAAGKAPFGTLAAKVDGGWKINGKKIFASLSGA